MDYFINSDIEIEIMRTIGNEANESGGLIGGLDNSTITSFYFDIGKTSSEEEYFPNTKLMENVLMEWEMNKISFMGIIHSHKDEPKLSGRDIYMAYKIQQCNPSITSLLMPILILNENRIIWYEVTKYQVKLIEVKSCNSKSENK